MFWLRKPRRSATWRHGPGTGAWTTLPSAARPGAPPAPSRFRAGMARAATGGPPVPRPPCTLGSAWNCCGAPFSGAGAGAWGRGAAHTGPRRAGEPLTGPSGGRGAPHSGPRGQGSRSQVPSGAGSRSRCPRSPGPSGIRSKQWSVWKDHAVKTVLSGASRVPWIQPRRSTAAQRKMPQSSAPGTHASEYPGTEREDDPHEMERFSPTLWSNLVFRREESC